MTLEIVSSNKSFGGWHKRYRHRSSSLNCDMVFAVYLPPQAEQGGKLPVLYWLSGLTCTDENFMQKAGAQRMAAGPAEPLHLAENREGGEGEHGAEDQHQPEQPDPNAPAFTPAPQAAPGKGQGVTAHSGVTL